jgi:hypothetical protein
MPKAEKTIEQRNEEVQIEPTSRDICFLYTTWKKGKYQPNKRKVAILQLWEAFMDEHPVDFDNLVINVPNLMAELWEIACIEDKQP